MYSIRSFKEQKLRHIQTPYYLLEQLLAVERNLSPMSRLPQMPLNCTLNTWRCDLTDSTFHKFYQQCAKIFLYIW
ncbi:hypothetical protein FGO68_gene13129 [Halteria grandinella]|uniref:Uncharacterized protein n=1 Tax=Halteria grandinella TaxID=5974 RepID=A0A8J8NLU8_HALGN|nr:hypothetical protein FGO68_gene13129 [Halteria grandinella]